MVTVATVGLASSVLGQKINCFSLFLFLLPNRTVQTSSQSATHSIPEYLYLLPMSRFHHIRLVVFQSCGFICTHRLLVSLAFGHWFWWCNNIWAVPVADGQLLRRWSTLSGRWGQEVLIRFKWLETELMTSGKAAGFQYVRWFLDLKGEQGGTSHCPSTFLIYHSQGTGKLLVGLISRGVELLLCAVEYKLR